MPAHFLRSPASRVTFAGIALVAMAASVAGGLAPASASSGSRHDVSYVSSRLPVTDPSRTLAATRSADLAPPATPTAPGVAANSWKTLFTMPGSVVHDVDFVNRKVGFAAAELGQVWKTTDGGSTWTKVLNRGFPYYYYGVDALSKKRLVVSGFNNQTSEGILTWSNDGGATWQPDQIISPNAWVSRIRFAGDTDHALAMNGLGASGTDPNVAWYTTKRDVWHTVVPDPDGGWFGSQFTLLADQSAYASGITYCTSADTGADWSCRPSVDSVFDGATEFVDAKHGWVGGGEISPDVAGWVHRTANGGSTWSGRVLDTPWPIRQLEFLDAKTGWAAGGDVFSGVGGIYFTSDGGKTWVQDLDSGDEVGSCSHAASRDGSATKIWCIGSAFNGSQFVSTVYRTTVGG